MRQVEERGSTTGASNDAFRPRDPSAAADRITEDVMQLLYVASQDLTETLRGDRLDLERALTCVHDATHALREIAGALNEVPDPSGAAPHPFPARRPPTEKDLAAPGRWARWPHIARHPA